MPGAIALEAHPLIAVQAWSSCSTCSAKRMARLNCMAGAAGYRLLFLLARTRATTPGARSNSVLGVGTRVTSSTQIW